MLNYLKRILFVLKINSFFSLKTIRKKIKNLPEEWTVQGKFQCIMKGNGKRERASWNSQPNEMKSIKSLSHFKYSVVLFWAQKSVHVDRFLKAEFLMHSRASSELPLSIAPKQKVKETSFQRFNRNDVNLFTFHARQKKVKLYSHTHTHEGMSGKNAFEMERKNKWKLLLNLAAMPNEIHFSLWPRILMKSGRLCNSVTKRVFYFSRSLDELCLMS